jgi:hypothetical protein
MLVTLLRMRPKSWKGLHIIFSRNVSNTFTVTGRCVWLHRGLIWSNRGLNDCSVLCFSEKKSDSGNILKLPFKLRPVSKRVNFDPATRTYLIRMNLIHTFISCLFKIHFIIILTPFHKIPKRPSYLVSKIIYMIYRMFLLSLPWLRKLYCMESLHPPGYSPNSCRCQVRPVYC